MKNVKVQHQYKLCTFLNGSIRLNKPSCFAGQRVSDALGSRSSDSYCERFFRSNRSSIRSRKIVLIQEHGCTSNIEGKLKVNLRNCYDSNCFNRNICRPIQGTCMCRKKKPNSLAGFSFTQSVMYGKLTIFWKRKPECRDAGLKVQFPDKFGGST